MKKVALLCSSGYSASMMVKAMQEYVHKHKLSFEIKAFAICDTKSASMYGDVIVLTPQVKFNIAKVQQLCEGKVVALLPQAVFEKADAKEAIHFIKQQI